VVGPKAGSAARWLSAALGEAKVREWFDDWVVATQFRSLRPHHPILRNLDIETCEHEGGFTAISRAWWSPVSGFMRGDIVSEALSARQSPAAKIPFLAAGWSLCFSEGSSCHPG